MRAFHYPCVFCWLPFFPTHQHLSSNAESGHMFAQSKLPLGQWRRHYSRKCTSELVKTFTPRLLVSDRDAGANAPISDSRCRGRVGGEESLRLPKYSEAGARSSDKSTWMMSKAFQLSFSEKLLICCLTSLTDKKAYEAADNEPSRSTEPTKCWTRSRRRRATATNSTIEQWRTRRLQWRTIKQ